MKRLLLYEGKHCFCFLGFFLNVCCFCMSLFLRHGRKIFLVKGKTKQKQRLVVLTAHPWRTVVPGKAKVCLHWFLQLVKYDCEGGS